MAHKCYISFKTEDIAYKKYLQEKLSLNIIDKSLDDPIDSQDEEYIMQVIRKDYLADSTVTIFLIGTRSAETLGEKEQYFIKRELRASLFNGKNNPRSGILGIVLPAMKNIIFHGTVHCSTCLKEVYSVNVSHETVIKEFYQNFYLNAGSCHYTESDRYCVLTSWDEFIDNPDYFIELAFQKRSAPIAAEVKVRF